MGYSSEIKAKAIRLRVEKSLGLADISNTLNISKSTASVWLKSYPLPESILEEKLKRKFKKIKNKNNEIYSSRAIEKAVMKKGMDTNGIGTIGELKVMLLATEKGYTVSVPHGHANKYDIIIDKDGKLYRAQIKTIRSDGISARVGTVSVTQKLGKLTNNKYSMMDIDCLIVYDLTTSRCAWLDSSIFGKNGVRMVVLRYFKTLNNQTKKIKLFSDYEW